jgi:hypothetical protein
VGSILLHVWPIGNHLMGILRTVQIGRR